MTVGRVRCLCRHYAGEIVRRPKRRLLAVSMFVAFKSGHLPRAILLTQGTLAKARRGPADRRRSDRRKCRLSGHEVGHTRSAVRRDASGSRAVFDESSRAADRRLRRSSPVVRSRVTPLHSRPASDACRFGHAVSRVVFDRSRCGVAADCSLSTRPSLTRRTRFVSVDSAFIDSSSFYRLVVVERPIVFDSSRLTGLPRFALSD